MSRARLIALTAFAMIPLAANSWLCRAALRDTAIDPASFTSLRLLSGALMLWVLLWFSGRLRSAGSGNWPSAFALFGYAALFSFAYLSLTAATGALLLFGAVQVTMIAIGVRQGERLDAVQLVGVLLAFSGLAILLLPGLSAPPLLGAMMMIGAGIGWGVYSVRGKGAGDPTRVTAGNFARTVPITLLLSLLLFTERSLDPIGVGYAVTSGAVTSALGYALWYSIMPHLPAFSAATVQLSVPVIVAIGGVVLLREPMTLRLLIASAAVLGGIGLVMLERRRRATR
ncbi:MULTISPECIES: DMT family transporter [Thiorhodovibrio]|uniref:DMT family transporter n=1 Tax=Thiorhodovibrio TaxID=61593 RepID=UPI001912328B|nr:MULTISPECIES: DMT family transporter [Thiorhodovibrio]MBK5970043.1 EamA family transporter [Thiorhodovibrio winogradskyi]WPL12969.1 threonine and homoserine efflux system [Thiorhodovibrio litoralis]